MRMRMVAYTTSVTDTAAAAAVPALDDSLASFLAAVTEAFAVAASARLVLAKPRPAVDELQRVTVRPVSLKGETLWSFVYTHKTRDLTKNLAPADGAQRLRELLETRFQHAHLFTPAGEVQLLTSKK